MFSKAYQTVSAYTHAVFVARRHFDGTISTGIGTFIVINREGWVATCAHLFSDIKKHQEDIVAIENYRREFDKIMNDNSIPAKNKKKYTDKLKRNPKWITEWYSAWSDRNFAPGNLYADDGSDLAIVKLLNYDPDFCTNYPVFKNPDNLPIATSLCKIGYPFCSVETTYDEAKRHFHFHHTATSLFPIEGVFTRFNDLYDNGGKFMGHFIETSSPGLKGQSGGPTFDKEGNVWAIQSQTISMNLDFKPVVKEVRGAVTAHQFINLGLGIHVRTILNKLDELGADYELSQE